MEHDLHHGHGVVVEDGGDIFGGELVGCVGDEQASLTHGTVTDHDTPRRRDWWLALAGRRRGRHVVIGRMRRSRLDEVVIMLRVRRGVKRPLR